MENEDLARLEKLVDTLIENYSSLKDKFHNLEERLRDSEDERELLKMELTELQEQRSEVGRRVSGLLGRIEQWESEQGGSEHMTLEQVDGEDSELIDSDPTVTF
ncbi:MAG: cell division protein ZapB [Candidatus Electrothrix sp. ATG1]|nr:cell division protein ZapB [Candidatus Electrothrix sp. ATG1]